MKSSRNSKVTSAPEPFLIGTLAERSMHAHIKRAYTEPGDLVEEKLEGYWVDIRRGENVIEIQTANFGNMKRKLTALLPDREVCVVHPVAVEKWITKLAKDGTTFLSRRKSPKRGCLYDLFDELVSFPQLILEKNFSVEVALVKEEELRCEDGKGSWRRKGTSIKDHLLLEILSRHRFSKPHDFIPLLPTDWNGPSTNRELAQELKQPYSRIARMTYCLTRMNLIRAVGKTGNSVLFELVK